MSTRVLTFGKIMLRLSPPNFLFFLPKKKGKFRYLAAGQERNLFGKL